MKKPAEKKFEMSESCGVSFPQGLMKDAREKAARLDVSFSKYVQRLVRLDLEKELLKP